MPLFCSVTCCSENGVSNIYEFHNLGLGLQFRKGTKQENQLLAVTGRKIPLLISAIFQTWLQIPPLQQITFIFFKPLQNVPLNEKEQLEQLDSHITIDHCNVPLLFCRNKCSLLLFFLNIQLVSMPKPGLELLISHFLAQYFNQKAHLCITTKAQADHIFKSIFMLCKVY